MAAHAVLGVVLLTAAACGGGGGGSGDYDPPPTEPPPPTQPPQPLNDATVTMRSRASDGYSAEEHYFTPTQVTLRRGGTVTWTNESGIAHNVTFGGTGAPENVTSHTSGSHSRTFPTTGSFAYSCTNHGGMNGSITVVD